MQDNSLTVIIDKPIDEVFEFTTNPNNTHKWIDGIQKEKTNEWPPQLNTLYQNRSNETAPWSTYVVTKYVPGKEFELKKQDSTYSVNYIYSSAGTGKTKLVYHEWVTEGHIDGPFKQETLDKLKTIMEAAPELTASPRP